MRINQRVTTPYGLGTIQGGAEGGYLVRIDLDKLTDKSALLKAWTKHPNKSILLVVAEKDCAK